MSITVVPKPDYPRPVYPSMKVPDPLPPKPTRPVDKTVDLVTLDEVDDTRIGECLTRLFSTINDYDLDKITPEQAAAARRLGRGDGTFDDLDQFVMWVDGEAALHIYARIPVSGIAMAKYERDLKAWEDHKAKIVHYEQVEKSVHSEALTEYYRLKAPWDEYDKFCGKYSTKNIALLERQMREAQDKIDEMQRMLDDIHTLNIL